MDNVQISGDANPAVRKDIGVFRTLWADQMDEEAEESNNPHGLNQDEDENLFQSVLSRSQKKKLKQKNKKKSNAGKDITRVRAGLKNFA